MSVFSVCGIIVIHGCHTIVPRPLILRPDFVTAGLVSFAATTMSCTTLLWGGVGWGRGCEVSVSRLSLLV